MRDLTGDFKVITNLSDHPRTEQEFSALNKTKVQHSSQTF